MGPVRQNPIQRTVRSVHMCVHCSCTIVAHNIAQNRPDNFPSYPPDNHHCSDDVYLREGVQWKWKATQSLSATSAIMTFARQNSLVYPDEVSFTIASCGR